MSWSFGSDTTCFDSNFLGIVTRTCESSWLFWGTLGFVVVYLLVQAIRIFWPMKR